MYAFNLGAELRVTLSDSMLSSPVSLANSIPSSIIASPAPVQGVPEPTTAILGVVGASFITLVRGRRRA
ncbi:hypothetical protein PLANPX_5519 [Lacipirellula parvula]|uniref:PEP-CTERM protein-sorting domain-containing protein n=1 Tax=Lacipirellula parvula TaxID=2650471 RepID=A0A5K7XIQ2_9BACT|nr:hypothetical protein PLANPX_5519 [Lacipirellula parvula]